MNLLEIENKTFVYEGLINEENALENSFNLFSYQRLYKVISRLMP